MAKRVISAAWDGAVADLKRDGRTYLIIAMALIMVPFTLLGVIDPELVKMLPDSEHEASISASVIELLVNVSSLVAQLAIIVLTLSGRETVGEAIIRGLKLLPSVVAAIILLIGPFLLVFILILGSAVGFDNLLDGSAEPIAEGDIRLWSALLLMVALAGMIFAVVRACLLTPVAAAERAGPIAMLRRSWQLTEGRFWRLFGFLLLFGFAMVVLFGSVGLVVGILVNLTLGAPEPFTAAALLTGLAAGFSQAMTGLMSGVIMANIYKRLAAPDATVPNS